jgi:RNA polymerase sigma-70 factor (ECF subfamily)
MDFSDIEIISQIKQGNKQAFEKLFIAYYGRLCEYSNTLCHDKEAAVEIVQDFFVKLWDNRFRINITSLKPYLFKAIHNNTIKYIIRKTSTEPLRNDHEYGSETMADFELSQTLEKAIAELPAKCKEVFILSRMDRIRHKEIAIQLGISERTVEVQIRKASRVLKEKLKEYFSMVLF